MKLKDSNGRAPPLKMNKASIFLSSADLIWLKLNNSSFVLIYVMRDGLISACLHRPKSVSLTLPSLSMKMRPSLSRANCARPARKGSNKNTLCECVPRRIESGAANVEQQLVNSCSTPGPAGRTSCPAVALLVEFPAPRVEQVDQQLTI